MDVVNEAVAQRINPAGAANTGPYGYLKGSATPSGTFGEFGPGDFMTNRQLSCAAWQAMSLQQKQNSLSAYFYVTRSLVLAVTEWSPSPWAPLVAQVDAYCRAQNPATQYAPHGTPAPHAMATMPHYMVKPAGQVAAPTSQYGLGTVIFAAIGGGIIGYFAGRR